jgi:mono/diheme cytochrome c family protein
VSRPFRTRTGRRALSAAVVAVVAALGATGCSKDAGDINHGKQLFLARCGTCHQLADANTSATIGPNLDDAFHAAREAGMDADTVAGVVKAQVENPRPSTSNASASMPKDLVTGQDLDDVAAYVGAVAGTGIKPPKIPGGEGGQVFASNGCSGCHTLAAAKAAGTTGPDLDQVIPGMSAAEIKQSIVDPNAKIAPGYSAGIMPSNFGQAIPADQLKALVDFLMKYAGKTGSSG